MDNATVKDSPPELIRSNRLSIADLLLITLGTAIAIWFLHSPQTSRETPFVFVNVCMAPLYGSAIAAVLLGCYRVAMAVPFKTEPGHWLLVMIGTVFLGCGMLSRFSLPYQFDPENNFSVGPQGLLFLFGICLLMVSLGLVVASVYANDHQPLRWRIVFRLIGWMLLLGVIVSLFLPAGGAVYILMWLLPLIGLALLTLAFLTTIFAAIMDLRERRYRDHWHWLGVAAFLGLPAHLGLLILAENLIVAQFP
jgi:hypothetical protein